MTNIGTLMAPYRPVDISDAERVFPASVGRLMPAYGSVTPSREWRDLQSRWFFSGLPPETEFRARDGVDTRAALRHLSAIQGSWEPKHEHKEEAVAFLLGEWFESVVTPDRTYVTSEAVSR